MVGRDNFQVRESAIGQISLLDAYTKQGITYECYDLLMLLDRMLNHCLDCESA